jgi:hypothetical protein
MIRTVGWAVNLLGHTLKGAGQGGRAGEAVPIDLDEVPTFHSPPADNSLVRTVRPGAI